MVGFKLGTRKMLLAALIICNITVLLRLQTLESNPEPFSLNSNPLATYKLYSPAVCPCGSWSRLPTVLSFVGANSPGWLLRLSIKQEGFDL